MIESLADTLALIAELAVLFFAVTVAVQLFQVRFGPDRLRAWMGGRPLPAALKGTALGFTTPFCTFTAIPMLVGLRQARVPPAGYVAFIVAAPVLDPVLFGALWLIAGATTAAVYVGVALVAAIGLAVVAQRIDIERHLVPVGALLASGDSPVEAPSCGAVDPDGSGCGSGEPHRWQGLRREVPVASRSAAALLRGLAPILLAGVVLSLIIEHAVPPDLTGRLTSASPTFSVPIAAAIGTPMYVSTTVFVPIAAALQAAGVGIGAVVALTIAGAGANLPELVILSRLARARVIAIFFIYVFGIAVAGGLLTQAIAG